MTDARDGDDGRRFRLWVQRDRDGSHQVKGVEASTGKKVKLRAARSASEVDTPVVRRRPIRRPEAWG